MQNELALDTYPGVVATRPPANPMVVKVFAMAMVVAVSVAAWVALIASVTALLR